MPAKAVGPTVYRMKAKSWVPEGRVDELKDRLEADPVWIAGRTELERRREALNVPVGGLPEMTPGADAVCRGKNPPHNEDAAFSFRLPNGVLCSGVFDGVGGYADGEAASRTARDAFMEILTAREADIVRDPVQVLREAVPFAAERMPAHTPWGKLPATVLSLTLLVPGDSGVRAVTLAIGDSRTYFIPPERRVLLPLTVDNQPGGREVLGSLEDVLSLWGRSPQPFLSIVKNEDYRSNERTLHEFRRRNLVDNSLSHDGSAFQISDVTVPWGSTFLVGSDGGIDPLPDDEILETVLSSPTPYEATGRLADKAAKRLYPARAKKDDVTWIVIKVPSQPGPLIDPNIVLPSGGGSIMTTSRATSSVVVW